MKFKDENNKVHDIPDEHKQLLIDKGYTEISDAEAIILQTPPPMTDDEFNRSVDAELRELDLQSIRSLREWVAAQPSAPQFLKDFEASADAKRATRK